MVEEPLDVAGHEVVAQAFGSAELEHVGWFRYFFADERWEWSPQVARMHGYPPDGIAPTTDLVLSHKHPDDLEHVSKALRDVRRTAGAFSTRHRIVDTGGAVHQVVVVGDQLFGEDGGVIGTHGFYVDVTHSVDVPGREHAALVSEAVAEIAAARGGIEQTTGMLMLIYRISAESATELLEWRSQETKVALRRLAEQIASDFLELHYDDSLPVRAVYDRLLLTAHLRIPD